MPNTNNEMIQIKETNAIYMGYGDKQSAFSSTSLLSCRLGDKRANSVDSIKSSLVS